MLNARPLAVKLVRDQRRIFAGIKLIRPTNCSSRPLRGDHANVSTLRRRPDECAIGAASAPFNRKLFKNCIPIEQLPSTEAANLDRFKHAHQQPQLSNGFFRVATDLSLRVASFARWTNLRRSVGYSGD